MSVRAIAIRSGPRPLPRRRPGLGAVARTAGVRAGTRLIRVRRRSFRSVFADDRGLIGVKLILIGIVALAMMAMEVPW